MKNKLIDLNNHLFSQMERLGEEGLDPEKIKQEIDRSKAMAGLGMTIINNAKVALEAQKLLGDNTIHVMPEMIEHQNGN